MIFKKWFFIELFSNCNVICVIIVLFSSLQRNKFSFVFPSRLNSFYIVLTVAVIKFVDQLIQGFLDFFFGGSFETTDEQTDITVGPDVFFLHELGVSTGTYMGIFTQLFNGYSTLFA